MKQWLNMQVKHVACRRWVVDERERVASGGKKKLNR